MHTFDGEVKDHFLGRFGGDLALVRAFVALLHRPDGKQEVRLITVLLDEARGEALVVGEDVGADGQDVNVAVADPRNLFYINQYPFYFFFILLF